MQKNTGLRTADLAHLSHNHTSNMQPDFTSERAFITLADFEAFLQEAKKTHGDKFDGLQIYFVRYPHQPDAKPQQQYKLAYSPKNDLSQVSLVFVAAHIKSGSPAWTIQNLEQKGLLSAFPVCNPAVDNNTGLCPPACGHDGKDVPEQA